MIKIENVETAGWAPAIRGMRNPMNSWDKSDSIHCGLYNTCETCELYSNGIGCIGGAGADLGEGKFKVGPSDHALAMQLRNAGTDHRKFMRMIVCYADITAPLYWWSEMDTYRAGAEKNSCSKMHKLLAKPFEMSGFSFDRLPGYKNDVKQFRPEISEEMVAKEIWVNVGEEYMVSNYGRVMHKFKNHYRIVGGSIHKDGYIFATVYGKQHPVHRIVAWAFMHEAYDESLVVNHIDGNKQNNFASNLEWVTQKENIAHSYANHLQPSPVSTYKGKFTEDQRGEIKRLWDSGEMSKRKIAEKFGVSHTCINNIINDKYKYAERINVYEEVARPIVDTLNELRDSWFRCEDAEEKKRIWYAIIQLLPESYNQRRTVQMSYEALSNMYHARKHHKLDEWREFCRWVETLPYSEFITGEETHD